ncbi:MAG TPA: 2-amino-4-hydroxy-6-hydroxymethyldihydropteridine diphosphokinase [Candidatus Angelobacter sp.]|nr:2-amino-4-hydroxy-6-hydroxymethyldihydropteridine diphosphokinase [Candidatus Angelobacter sp.]
MKKKVYLSLGANVGDRAANLRQAVERLAGLGRMFVVSSLYETEPVEVEGQQPWYLNCSVAVETELMPRQFLSRILALERELGRRRTGVKSPRTLDIDILLFGDTVIETRELTVPHPAMQHRRFVLEPLEEIAPEARHPVLKLSVREMLEALPTGAGIVRKVGKV